MIYVCSDIHGNYEAYMKVINKLSENDTLYIIGDVIDRGSDGIKILLDIMQRKNVKFILGNHEWMLLLSVLSNWSGDFVDNWTCSNNGGAKTMKALLSLDDDTANNLVDFLLNSHLVEKIHIDGRVYNLIHGYFDKRIELYGGRTFRSVLNNIDKGNIWYGSLNYNVLWKSPLKEDPIEHYRTDEYYIHGHVPVIKFDNSVEPLVHRNITFIDGGLVFGGALILYNITNDTYELIR